MKLLICLMIIVLFLIIIIYVQYKQKSLEPFSTSDSLFIKKTNNFKKVYGNSKYTIWIPQPIDDYFPLGNYITFDKNPPTFVATLVKNNIGLNSNDKPIKYEIVSITNKNFAVWNPIADTDHLSLGHIYSKEYPSKYLIRTIPKKYCIKSNIKNRIIENKISQQDKGYELWDIQKSNLFVCNNLNNYNLNTIKNIYYLNNEYLEIEKKMYIKTINSYKKICNYKNDKLNKEFYIWRPIVMDNFCSLGDICLTTNINPNGKLDTVVVHKSFCKIPLNYGSKSISNIKYNNKNIHFWRPIPHNDHYFFGDIVVIGDEQPEADNLIYSVSLDYIKQIYKPSHNMIHNNVSSNNPFSIWSDNNNFFSVNNSYNNPIKNSYILNTKFMESDLDLSDVKQIINIKYTKNNNFKTIDNSSLIHLLKKNISDKIDINIDRLEDIKLKEDIIILNIRQRKSGTNELKIKECIRKLNKYIENEPVKIFNKNKDNYYITLLKLYKTKQSKFIEIDNSEFNNKVIE